MKNENLERNEYSKTKILKIVYFPNYKRINKKKYVEIKCAFPKNGKVRELEDRIIISTEKYHFEVIFLGQYIFDTNFTGFIGYRADILIIDNFLKQYPHIADALLPCGDIIIYE